VAAFARSRSCPARQSGVGFALEAETIQRECTNQSLSAIRCTPCYYRLERIHSVTEKLSTDHGLKIFRPLIFSSSLGLEEDYPDGHGRSETGGSGPPHCVRSSHQCSLRPVAAGHNRPLCKKIDSRKVGGRDKHKNLHRRFSQFGVSGSSETPIRRRA
jgi:hypothetical protein